jgi:hypothetical protein
MSIISLWALFLCCAVLTVGCTALGYVALRAGDVGSCLVLTVCAAVSGFMTGVVISWLREDFR